MSVRSALATMGRFTAAVTGLYFVVALGLLLAVFAARAFAGHDPIPDESVVDPIADLSTVAAVLLASWFLVEEYSLKRLFAFAVTVWASAFAVLLSIAAVERLVGPLSNGWPAVGALLVATGVLAYLGAYRLVYPDSFAERRRKYGLGD